MASAEGRFGVLERYICVGVPLGLDRLWLNSRSDNTFMHKITCVRFKNETRRADAAVAPALGKMSCLILLYANPAMMSLF